MGNREKRTLLVLWLLVMAVVIGVAFFIVNSIPKDKPEPPALSTRVKAPKTPTPKVRAKASSPSNLQLIHLTSTPSGATVMENEQKIGTTPLKITRHIGLVSVFSFKLKGYITIDMQHTVTTFKPHKIHKTLERD